MASAGGTVFWEHASGIQEPTGRLTGGNVFDDTNTASYGPQWATEAHHIRLFDDEDQYHIVDYEAVAPLVGVTLEDVYDQTVVSDSFSLASVEVPVSDNTACDNAPGFLSGTTIITFENGTAAFTSLEPLCAPNHTLGLSVAAVIGSVSDNAAFQFNFRGCVRGEYYEERICNPCEEGTYSFADPAMYPLSEITKAQVCMACPPEALYCYKDTMTLRQGYWRSENDSTNILECPWDAESCLGGQSSGDASCGSGYHGPLCAICEDDYHYVSSSRTCEPCDDTASFFDPFTVTLLVLVCFIIVVVMYCFKRIVRKEKVISLDDFIAICLLRLKIYHKDKYTEQKAQLFQHIYILRTRAYKSCVVYLTFYQILSTLPFILAEVDFPDVYDRMMSAVSVVNLAINQESVVSCSSGAQYDYVTRLVVKTSFPVVIVLLLWLCCQIHMWYICRVDDSTGCNRGSIALKYRKAVLVLTFLILPSGTY